MGMISDFEMQLHGAAGTAWLYPRFFWEAGLLGQVYIIKGL